MDKIKHSYKIEKHIIDLGDEGLFAYSGGFSHQTGVNSQKTIDGVPHYKTGTYIDNVYRCDQLGNAIEVINDNPKYYRLYEYEIAVSTDAFGNPSDFVSFGYDIESK